MSGILQIDAGNENFELSSKNIERYKEDGAILLRNFMRNETYQGVLQDLEDRVAILEDYYRIANQRREISLSSISERMINLEKKYPETQSALFDVMSKATSMHQFSCDKRLLNVARSILSPSLAVHQRLILIMSYPRNEWHLSPWHQDWLYNEGPHSTLTVHAPLHRSDSRNGSLLLALGEHDKLIQHEECNYGIKTKWLSLPPEIVERFDNVVSLEFEPGDVLLFHSLVPHSARINQSDQVRFVINARYQDLADKEFTRDLWRVNEARTAREALSRRPSVLVS